MSIRENSKISSDLDTKTFMNKMGILKLVVGRLEAYINHVTVLADSIEDRILDDLILVCLNPVECMIWSAGCERFQAMSDAEPEWQSKIKRSGL